MKKIHEFCPADRYVYDLGLCSSSNGFAQVDTRQDASYYGTWANPVKLVIFSYCEGDCYTTVCETPAEFTAEMRRIKEFHGEDWRGVDPGWHEKDGEPWRRLGLGELLH